MHDIEDLIGLKRIFISFNLVIFFLILCFFVFQIVNGTETLPSFNFYIFIALALLPYLLSSLLLLFIRPSGIHFVPILVGSLLNIFIVAYCIFEFLIANYCNPWNGILFIIVPALQLSVFSLCSVISFVLWLSKRTGSEYSPNNKINP